MSEAMTTGLRTQNERAVLTLIRRHGAVSKAQIARRAGLTVQTISVITRQLETDHLILRGPPQRGRVGQPTVPLSLDAEGAFFLGAKIGRRSLGLVLIDFLGRIRHETTRPHDFPQVEPTIDWLVAEARSAADGLGANGPRLSGLGIAMPFELWNWADRIGAPPGAMTAWRTTDIRAEIAARVPFPVHLQNDATAACGAELLFGEALHLRDFLYVYIGTFVGGGLVLNGGLYSGPTGNAAALGSMPVLGADGTIAQLIDLASLDTLERRLAGGRLGFDALTAAGDDWLGLGAPLTDWIETAARGLAQAILAAASVLDIEAVVIDGALPGPCLARLIERTRAAMTELDTSGLHPPAIRPGSIGRIARALGGASLPLFDRFLAAADVDPHAPP